MTANAACTPSASQLRIGPLVIGMQDLRTRCLLTTFDRDSGQQDFGMSGPRKWSTYLRTGIRKTLPGIHAAVNCTSVSPDIAPACMRTSTR